MKRICFSSILILFYSFVNAQFFQYAEGPVFPLNDSGFAKIIQLKNGNTMFMHIDLNNGIDIHVYASEYKRKTEEHIEPAFGKIKSGKMEGVFEMNGDAVIMIADLEAEGNTIKLYRLIVDGTTAKLKEEKLVATGKRSIAKAGVKNQDELPQSEMHVSKDPHSENYTVAIINPFVSDSSKRIEMIVFGKDNMEINRAFYKASTEKYKFLKYLDMAVIGSDKQAMLLYGYNNKTANEVEGELILADLTKGAMSVAFNELNFSNDLQVESGITRYNRETKKLLLLTTAKVRSESKKLNAYLAVLDPFSRKLITNIVFEPGEKVKNKYAELFGKKTSYSGMPQNLVIHNDGSFSIIAEEHEQIKVNDTLSKTMMRNLTVVEYNMNAEYVNSYFIPMDQQISNAILPSFYQSYSSIVAQQLNNESKLRSPVYINDGHNSFVLFNDADQNNQSAKMKELDAVFYKIGSKELTPARNAIYGKPVEKKDHNQIMFTVSDYDKANNIFVTLKFENEGAHPGVKLVWLQP